MRVEYFASKKVGTVLDDLNVLKQRDTAGALEVAASLYQQVSYDCELAHATHDGRQLTAVVIAGMGGSALAADVLKVLLRDEITIPFEVVKDYHLPAFVGKNTLVIASSHSGNTEETVSCLNEAIERGCQLAVTSTGGKLKEIADKHDIMFAPVHGGTQPRMGMIYNLRSILRVLVEFGLASKRFYGDMATTESWLESESELWGKDMPTERNYAKQLALQSAGKIGMFYAGSLMAPVAYKWKISWNENAKNVAFWNYLPEFNHNEFLGWTSHPVEKPFAVFDLVSELEHPRVQKRFELTDKLLSGRRPKSIIVPIAGNTLLKHTLWGCILGDFVSIYLAILNNVDPTQVDLIEKFKKELA